MSNRMIPREVWLLVDYLHRNGLKTLDLFTVGRKYSKNMNINEIRDWLDTWSTVAYREFFYKQNIFFFLSLNKSLIFFFIAGTPHSTAEALLMLFESTPEPLLNIPDKDIINVCDSFDKCRALVINRVSPLGRRVFLYVCLFIRELRRHYDINHMNDRNLGEFYFNFFENIFN